MSCASSGHITKLKQSIFAPFDIYEQNIMNKVPFRIQSGGKCASTVLNDSNKQSCIISLFVSCFFITFKREIKICLNREKDFVLSFKIIFVLLSFVEDWSSCKARRPHNTQHNDTEHNDTQHNNNQDNDTQDIDTECRW